MLYILFFIGTPVAIHKDQTAKAFY